MTESPDPYFLTPRGTVPNQEAEANNPTIGRLNGALLDEVLNVTTEQGIFPIDRHWATQIAANVPGYGWSLHAQRVFLDQALAFGAERGIDQFVVLRAGLPLGPGEDTEHTLARAHIDTATTVLVAREHILNAHQTLVLEKQKQTRAASVRAAVHEVHRPLHTLHEPGNWRLDLGKPVFLSMVADPSHWPGDVTTLIRAYHHELPVGSVIVVSALGTAAAGSPASGALDTLAFYLSKTPEPHLTLRDLTEVESWFGDWRIEPPGVVPVSHWAGASPKDLAGPELPVWCVIATKTAP
ncbi:SAM-dependent methyltransferase [Amycolatopsis keratiniphila]|uniref:SAM-dependent methyltransferase n=1 Tax=Amycolatopsis keratiniphila TaxID=129921 RepID=UPI00087DEE5E|nr:SAM-dependent methyltransferase [Amycolatopsis keratiniphila]OLZ50311.1 hypothetical protein BS330_29045 [Amycolatopsis keratiniphila subsp. nogabecina]SDU67243.1 S-adenosyl methyltransferase [Amycolatopsis keratiniphila]